MRFFVIVWRLGPLVVSFLRDFRRWVFFGAPLTRSASFGERRARRLVEQVARLGPSFIKMAQLFSSRTDLLPEVYVNALSTLTDQVPPVDLTHVRAAIHEAYGQYPEELFERFEPLPVAAASLGQVHRARWHGEEVAVKVLRPGVQALVRKDMRVALPFMRWLTKRFPNPHVRNARVVIEEFATKVWEEMDFEHEAANAREIRANFAGNPRIIVPRVIDTLVRPRVLVLEFVEGLRIDRIPPRQGDQAGDPRGVVSSVMELYLQMMMVDGLFHADPHPGNLLVAPDGRIVLLDFGMVVRVPKELRRNLVQTVFSAIRKDVDGTIAGFASLGLLDPAARPEHVRGLAETLFRIAYDPRSMRERIELVANEVMAALYDWPVRLPSEMVYFARTAALIEGLGVKYDAYFNPITFASPIAIRMRGRIMSSLQEHDAAGGSGLPLPLSMVDWPTALGAAAGLAARTVADMGARFFKAFLDAVGSEGAEPPAATADAQDLATPHDPKVIPFPSGQRPPAAPTRRLGSGKRE